MNGRWISDWRLVGLLAAVAAWPGLAAEPGSAGAAEPATGGSRPAASRFVWFGTQTRGKTAQGLQSEGIYVSRFDDGTGELSKPVLAAPVGNPSFLARHRTRPLLYAVSEIADRSAASGRTTGGITAFRIDPATGMLTKLNEQPSGGGGPCHVSVDPSGRCILAANYGGGSTICLRIAEDGSLSPVAEGDPGGFIRHEGKSVDPARQTSPHAHCARPSPDGRFVLVPDLGIDRVLVHALDASAGTIRPHGHGAVAAGAGPRHFAFHPDGRHAYVINELALTITAFDWDPMQGSLRETATVSMLPADVADRKGMSAAELVVHPTGRFLYGSNRGHDTIVMFKLDAEPGKPEWIGAEPVRGRIPRAFSIDPAGRWLLAAGQNSDSVTTFAIDPETGRLAFTGRSIEVPRPVCVLFDDPLPGTTFSGN